MTEKSKEVPLSLRTEPIDFRLIIIKVFMSITRQFVTRNLNFITFLRTLFTQS